MNGTEITFDFKNAKKVFSRIGLALIAFFAATIVSQIILLTAIELFFPDFPTDNYSVLMIFSSATMYLIGFPAFYFAVKGIKTSEFEKKPVSIADIGIGFLIAMFFMQAGQFIGNAVYLTLYDSFGIDLSSTSLEIVSNTSWYESLVFAVIIGPLFEELIFRKLILDRVAVFGEKLAIIFSSLLFAFFHMSVQQFFYAFLIGLLLSYIYIRSKNVVTCYILHAIINFVSGVVPVLLFELVDMDAFLQSMATEDPEAMIRFVDENFAACASVAAYSFGSIALVIAGIVAFNKKRRTLFFEKAPLELPKDTEASVAFTNIGTVLFILFAVAYPFIEIYLSGGQ